jgi:hypothetical protein
VQTKLAIRIIPFLILAFLAVACSPTTSTPGTTAGELHPEVANNVIQYVNQRLDQEIHNLQVQQVERVEWPNACLGLPQQDEVCAQVITPGYRIVADINGQQYEIHTGLQGNKIRLQVNQGK